MGGALGGRASGKACLPSPAPFVGTEQWAFLRFSSYLRADRTQDNPACSQQPAVGGEWQGPLGVGRSAVALVGVLGGQCPLEKEEQPGLGQ